MNSRIDLILWSLALFQLKHFACDFVIQTSYQYRNKGAYGHPGGFIHAGLHATGSLPAILLLAPPGWLVAAIVGAEFVIHYHVDWLKEQLNRRYALTPSSSQYWTLFGADQLVHQMTYLAIILVLIYAPDRL